MLSHAPAPIVVSGLMAVPIHIQRLRASVILDVPTRSGYVDAAMAYRMGQNAGCAMFDLRQTIDQAWLDGRSIATARLRPHDVGEGPHATMRVLNWPQSAHSAHTLNLRYRLTQPHSDLGGAYPPLLAARSNQRLRWSFGMGDLFDGRHLEMWFPSNLPFDQFPFELVVKLTGTATKHTVITNGTVARYVEDEWHITFPAWFSSISPMIELRPTDELEHARGQVVLRASGRIVVIDVWKAKGQLVDLAHEAARIGQMLDANEAIFGPFAVERYTCFFHDADGGMEYAGATTTSSTALAHEVLHSWFARGVMPASDSDGWWDEAFTTYMTSGAAPVRLDFDRPPIELCSRRPFQRHTPAAAYIEGSRLFSGIAEMTGVASLRRSMRSLFHARARSCLSTAELERHLVLETGAVGIVDAFHRFVYGFDDPVRSSGVRFDGLSVTDEPDGHSWINAQVRNDQDGELCPHFLLLFAIADTQGSQMHTKVFPNVAAIAGFDLPPERTRTVRVRLPPIRSIPSCDPAAHFDIIGAVHVRLNHPTGHAIDYQERTMMRTGFRPVASSYEPLPAILSAE